MSIFSPYRVDRHAAYPKRCVGCRAMTRDQLGLWLQRQRAENLGLNGSVGQYYCPSPDRKSADPFNKLNPCLTSSSNFILLALDKTSSPTTPLRCAAGASRRQLISLWKLNMRCNPRASSSRSARLSFHSVSDKV